MSKRRLKKRIKKHNKPRPFDPNAKNRHHILWIGSVWNKGYAKKLRTHDWMVISIPRDTLHKAIHRGMACIPVPPEGLCKKAYFVLQEMESQGLLYYDTPIEERIDFLLAIWPFEEAPNTVLALIHQKKIIRDFYRNNQPP